jgi:hypothetical protein
VRRTIRKNFHSRHKTNPTLKKTHYSVNSKLTYSRLDRCILSHPIVINISGLFFLRTNHLVRASMCRKTVSFYSVFWNSIRRKLLLISVLQINSIITYLTCELISLEV